MRKLAYKGIADSLTSALPVQEQLALLELQMTFAIN